MVAKVNRLRELDFLRGIAIILVLLRHQKLSYLTNMGWIGVDLFFVLSGFLVSGLLFREYQKYGNMKPTNFLIRRGFKIYPIYYLFYVVYLIPILYEGTFKLAPFLCDMVFLQNYYTGFGYAYGASWSLAVEEHFYFGLALVLWFLTSRNLVKLHVEHGHSKLSGMEKGIIAIMITCLLMRFATNIYIRDWHVGHWYVWKNRIFAMTHLRIDSLLTGVLISYLFYFRHDYLKNVFIKHRKYAIFISLALISFTPFVSEIAFFTTTIGFTLLYIAFGIVLLYIVMDADINLRLNKLFGRRTVDFISKIGFCSYSIYIIHMFVNYLLELLPLAHYADVSGIPVGLIEFPLSFAFSVLCGKLMTDYIERFFLAYRDRHFPTRSKVDIKELR